MRKKEHVKLWENFDQPHNHYSEENDDITVQDLIDKLMAVEDKSLPVFVYDMDLSSDKAQGRIQNVEIDRARSRDVNNLGKEESVHILTRQ